MNFPDRKLYPGYDSFGPERPIVVRRLKIDPDLPHQHQSASEWGECDACGGSGSNTIHIEPLGGYPQ